MCDPVTIAATTAWVGANAATLLAVGSTAASVGGLVYQHNAQNAMSEQTAINAKQAFEISNAGITDRQLQDNISAADRRYANQSEYAAARASAITGAESGGVQGLSVDALLGDLAGQQVRRQSSIDQNLKWSTQQLQQERLGVAASRDSRIASAPKASGAALALDIAGTVATGFDKYKSRTDPSWSKG